MHHRRSQGGGGIFVHGWNHNLQVSNNRVYSNIGTLTGGINIGQGEFPPQYVQGSTTERRSGSCLSNAARQSTTQQPYCFNLTSTCINNVVTNNTSIGDELFSGTPAGAGGVTFCTGADYYKFNYNWVCGNMSTGDGGGVAHLGFSFNGDIEHNSILFNQSLNPTIPTNGGGLMVMGAPDTDPDLRHWQPMHDCPPGLSDGAGPDLVINANLIQGNAAEAGSRRRPALPERQRNRSHAASRIRPSAGTRSAGHQQHHRQQCGRLGWRRRIARRCPGGELHQQHHRLQRHHGHRGHPVQHPRRSSQLADAVTPTPDWQLVAAATGRLVSACRTAFR